MPLDGYLGRKQFDNDSESGDLPVKNETIPRCIGMINSVLASTAVLFGLRFFYFHEGVVVMWLNEVQKEGVYEAIFNRRDIRHFRKDEVPNEVLLRLLKAAHHAPSVGYMQPWNFIIIKSTDTKQKLKQHFDQEIQALGEKFTGERAEKYKTIKLEGVLEAPITLCITCDSTRTGPHIIGRNTIPETDVYSVVCAIQNLWLAAYAEGLAAGWVSFYRKDEIRKLLEIPPHIEPVALISIGYPYDYPEKPLLEKIGWGQRLPLEQLVFEEKWGHQP